jgi:hypothetical protein
MDSTKYLKLLSDYDVHCQHIIKSASVDTSETAADKLKRVRWLEKDYIRWFEFYFPHYAKKKSAKFHGKLANAIISAKIIRLIAEIFRSGAKSVHLDMGVPLYLYYVKKELFFFLLFGETDPKAKILLSGLQSEIEVNPRLKNDYGERMKTGDWSDGNFYTTDGVRFMSIGFMGMSPRGLRNGPHRPDYIVIDDVDSKKHINNNQIMSDAVDFITEEIEGCFDTDSDRTACERLVYANNNFNKNSITNRLKLKYLANIKADKEEGIDTDYKIFTVTAVVDTIDFVSNWPEKTSSEYWRRKYNRNPRSFMREYMHVHVTEGKIFKNEHFQWTKILPLSSYDALVLYGDLSYKEKADYKALTLMGKTGRHYHVLYNFCRQASRTDAAGWLYDLYEDRKLQNVNVDYWIEGLFAMDEFVSDFDTEGDNRGYHIAVMADKRVNINKFDRIESIDGIFIRRWMWFNEAEKLSKDQITLIDQLLAFEKGSGMNDDGPDSMHGCISKLNESTFQNAFDPIVIKRSFNAKRY